MSENARGTARKKALEPPGRGSAQSSVQNSATRPGLDHLRQPEREPEATSPEAMAEVATYIAQLTAELCRMADGAKLETLGYFLSMARLEAEMQVRRLRAT